MIPPYNTSGDKKNSPIEKKLFDFPNGLKSKDSITSIFLAMVICGANPILASFSCQLLIIDGPEERSPSDSQQYPLSIFTNEFRTYLDPFGNKIVTFIMIPKILTNRECLNRKYFSDQSLYEAVTITFDALRNFSSMPIKYSVENNSFTVIGTEHTDPEEMQSIIKNCEHYGWKAYVSDRRDSEGNIVIKLSSDIYD